MIILRKPLTCLSLSSLTATSYVHTQHISRNTAKVPTFLEPFWFQVENQLYKMSCWRKKIPHTPRSSIADINIPHRHLGPSVTKMVLDKVEAVAEVATAAAFPHGVRQARRRTPFAFLLLFGCRSCGTEAYTFLRCSLRRSLAAVPRWSATAVPGRSMCYAFAPALGLG